MEQIADWLKKLGMSEYARRFAENDIDTGVLPELTDQDLKDLGVSLGHRRKMLRAIRDLSNASDAVTSSSAPVATEPTRRDAERRQLTVMFTDLVGSTALSTKLDPEDLRSVIGTYHKCVAETVARFDGFVAKYMGDGVLVYFGYPHAHEDDAERAVRAGLALIEAVGKLHIQEPLQVRIGVATGVVVVGDIVGSGEAQERGVVGKTPNLAARLQGIAAPNTVVIAEGTRRLVGNLFELGELGAVDLKGIAGPVRAFAALRASTVESRFEALRATELTALVGREEELELLLRRWAKAKTHQGQVVLLAGEAGIGKSRLSVALMERLAGEPHTRLRYFCSPQHADSAFYPIIDQMERAAGLAHDDTPQAKLDKLDALLAQTSTSKQDAALFAEMLSLPNDGRYPALDLTPERRRHRTLEALMTQLERLARQQPVLMIFEDAHWTDPTSLEAFSRAVNRIKTLRVLLVFTFRPEFIATWVGQSHVTSLTLNRLGEREAAAIIARLVGNKKLPAGVMAEIVECTDGIPLFVEEMTKAVLEAESEGAARHPVAAVPSPPLAIPASLHASLMARLDRLGPAKEVAQIGAAIGREFSHALLASVLCERQAELGSALDRLIQAGLLFRQGVPPHASYLFKHALVRDAAYGTLLRSRRQHLHSHIAATLEDQFPQIVVAQPALLAQHCAEAGLAEKAVGYWLKAGQQALARSAMIEAEAQLHKGLALLPSVRDNTERQERELELHIALSWALTAAQGYATPAVAEVQARARQLFDQLGQPSQFAAWVLTRQFEYHLSRAELVLACQWAKEAQELGEMRTDPLIKFVGCNSGGAASFWLGEFTATRAYAEQALKLGRELRTGPRSPAARSQVPGQWRYAAAIAHTYLFLSQSYLGYPDQARAGREDALAVARFEPFSLALVLGYSLCIESEPTLLLQRCEELEAHCAEYGLTQFGAEAIAFHGSALSELDRAEEGVPLQMQGLATYRATGAALLLPRLLTELARGYGKAGRPSEGLQCLDEAMRQVEATQERWAEAQMYCVRGELFIAVRDFAAAEASIHQAIAVARQQQAKSWELHAATSMARLWRGQGKRQQAHDLLAPVYGLSITHISFIRWQRQIQY
jgi:class 3 adenylate cyclase